MSFCNPPVNVFKRLNEVFAQFVLEKDSYDDEHSKVTENLNIRALNILLLYIEMQQYNPSKHYLHAISSFNFVATGILWLLLTA